MARHRFRAPVGVISAGLTILFVAVPLFVFFYSFATAELAVTEVTNNYRDSVVALVLESIRAHLGATPLSLSPLPHKDTIDEAYGTGVFSLHSRDAFRGAFSALARSCTVYARFDSVYIATVHGHFLYHSCGASVSPYPLSLLNQTVMTAPSPPADDGNGTVISIDTIFDYRPNTASRWYYRAVYPREGRRSMLLPIPPNLSTNSPSDCDTDPFTDTDVPLESRACRAYRRAQYDVLARPWWLSFLPTLPSSYPASPRLLRAVSPVYRFATSQQMGVTITGPLVGVVNESGDHTGSADLLPPSAEAAAALANVSVNPPSWLAGVIGSDYELGGLNTALQAVVQRDGLADGTEIALVEASGATAANWTVIATTAGESGVAVAAAEAAFFLRALHADHHLPDTFRGAVGSYAAPSGIIDVQTSTERGVYFVSLQPIDSSTLGITLMQWYLVVGVPRGVVLEPVEAARLQTLLVGAPVLVVAVMIFVAVMMAVAGVMRFVSRLLGMPFEPSEDRAPYGTRVSRFVHEHWVMWAVGAAVHETATLQRLGRRQAAVLGSFMRFAPPTVVRDLVGHRASAAGQLGMDHLSEILVLFTDLQKFSSLAEALPASALQCVLGVYFSAAVTAVSAAGGTVLNFLGDGLFVIFNAPARIDAPDARACIAALSLCAMRPTVWAALRSLFRRRAGNGPVVMQLSTETLPPSARSSGTPPVRMRRPSYSAGRDAGGKDAGDALPSGLSSREPSIPALGAPSSGAAPDLLTRVGVHRGSAWVGNYGAPERMAFSAIGNAVNAASRFEGANKVFGTNIMVSGQVAAEAARQVAAAGSAFSLQFRPLGRITVEGQRLIHRVAQCTGVVCRSDECCHGAVDVHAGASVVPPAATAPPPCASPLVKTHTHEMEPIQTLRPPTSKAATVIQVASSADGPAVVSPVAPATFADDADAVAVCARRLTTHALPYVPSRLELIRMARLLLTRIRAGVQRRASAATLAAGIAGVAGVGVDGSAAPTADMDADTDDVDPPNKSLFARLCGRGKKRRARRRVSPEREPQTTASPPWGSAGAPDTDNDDDDDASTDSCACATANVDDALPLEDLLRELHSCSMAVQRVAARRALSSFDRPKGASVDVPVVMVGAAYFPLPVEIVPFQQTFLEAFAAGVAAYHEGSLRRAARAFQTLPPAHIGAASLGSACMPLPITPIAESDDGATASFDMPMSVLTGDAAAASYQRTCEQLVAVHGDAVPPGWRGIVVTTKQVDEHDLAEV
eukprot:TRINITY_DN12784_c0_g1_i1.p1 TRINITY_DN12784_c0_g1~~TRINITY_DN12784_c0_g1_i1.p1  ORF type:complete len:1254 (+),score=232.83 TRINITY_DN12784_c0_g1_i1:378-4139(+)